MLKDYYRILGIPPKATLPEIKQAYRQLSHKYHPDKNKDSNAAALFIEITEAYEVLRDSAKRISYDTLYNRFFSQRETSAEEAEQQKQWSEHGQQKGKHYSEMDYDEFSRTAFAEIRLGARYIPSLIFIGLCILGAVSVIGILPKAFKDRSAPAGAGLAFLIVAIGLATLAYFLFIRMKTDYLKERNQTIKQRKS